MVISPGPPCAVFRKANLTPFPVRLSEPFAPLPKTQEDVDILHVTRTWQFMPGGELIDR